MWCLQTIVDLNQKMVKVKNIGQANVDCGIRGSSTEKIWLETKLQNTSEEKVSNKS